jgi:hypothetical protein
LRKNPDSASIDQHSNPEPPTLVLSANDVRNLIADKTEKWAMAIRSANIKPENHFDDRYGSSLWKTKTDLVVMPSGGWIFALFALSVARSLNISGAVIPRSAFTQAGSQAVLRDARAGRQLCPNNRTQHAGRHPTTGMIAEAAPLIPAPSRRLRSVIC